MISQAEAVPFTFQLRGHRMVELLTSPSDAPPGQDDDFDEDEDGSWEDDDDSSYWDDEDDDGDDPEEAAVAEVVPNPQPALPPSTPPKTAGCR